MIDIFTKYSGEELPNYIVATYEVESTVDLADAAWNIAIGQSVGNPQVRSRWENDRLIRDHSCLILQTREELKGRKSGKVVIAFPMKNLGMLDGISQVLVQLMGGQLDIDSIVKCRLTQVWWPEQFLQRFKGPSHGLTGMRELTGRYNRPLLGAIIKPKVVNDVGLLAAMVEELAEGGVDFIKEDEIMADVDCCPIYERLPRVLEVLGGRPIVYCCCINSDPGEAMQRFRLVSDLGGNGVHLNFWTGLGMFNELREENDHLPQPLFIHFQKSGDKILTSRRNAYSIDWRIVCDIAGMSGCDTIHAGMWGGYLADDEAELKDTVAILHSHNTVPALSCGMHPGLIAATRMRFGNDWMANAGGAIHGHPGGSLAGVRAFRQAIDGNFGDEYYQAIEKWGCVD